jgi:hypothetical protein
MVFKMKKVIVYTDWHCQPHFTPVHALIQCFCVQFLHFGKKDAQRQNSEPLEPWTSKKSKRMSRSIQKAEPIRAGLFSQI